MNAVLEQLVDLLGVLLGLPAAAAARERVAAAEDSLVQAVLLRGRLEERLLVRRLGHEAVHLDFFRLADAVAPRHRLEIVLRVPVGVVNDGGVGGGERDAHAAGSCGEQVDEALAVCVEAVDAGLAISLGRAAVEPFVFVAHQVEVVAEDVEDDCELRKDENLVSLRFQLGKELVQEHHLTAGLREHVQGRRRRRRGRRFDSSFDRLLRGFLRGELDRAGLLVAKVFLHPVAQKRVVANLAEFHAQVTKLRHVLALVPFHQHVNLFLVDHAVVGPLFRGELYPDDDLFLSRDLLDIFLHPSKHAGLEHLA